MITATHRYMDKGLRRIIAFDSLMLVLPFIAYLSDNYWACLLVLNLAVPTVHACALYSGISSFQHWQGRWKNLETAWMLALSTTACFMMLALLANWYVKAGWNIIGIYDNMLWSYMHYCSGRVVLGFHRYARKYG